MKKESVNFNTIDELVFMPIEDTFYDIEYGDSGQGKKSLTINLDRAGVVCKIYCGYKVSAGKVIDLTTTVVHNAPNTISDTTIRGVLLNGGVSNYQGKVVVKKEAYGSLSKLEDSVLVIGQATHNHAEPFMQIETDDVSATHSSSTSRVDDQQVYYLESRGLSRVESEDLLVEAFLAYEV